ncbi:mannitol dehydrogenase family protein [uncultured Eudoraea sp.]|uniref:mannitol dehydrogenase family protein n=1 Tax=uncultured Eudoraea sp. TaxID=1035614 RepID=UPI0026327540|nr:mannitol dehydrogenase family protein [uncultured Eudoraea sp.]
MEKPMQLNQANLQEVGSRIPVPTYARTSDNIEIVHIGVGGFHRAHLAYYLHLLKKGGAASALCGIGLREADNKLSDIFKTQNHLYTLIVKHPDGKIEPEVIGSIVDFKMGTTDPEPVIARMAVGDTKIVSLTITEGGYNFNPNTGEFNFDNPDIQHELQHPQDPKTVYGFLTAALKRRRDAGLPAFTILVCDNIEHNGDMMRKMLGTFAEAQDPDLANWIAQEVSFPNSMVDRITPVTTPADIETLAQDYGVADAWPVTCEPFIQWVVEDKFSNGRPAFEKVGVQFVPDVGPYEKMKLRLLNAGHSVLGLLGALHGHPTINACVEDELFATYLRAFFDQAKLPKFLIATIHENLETGGSIKFATLVIAAWCYYCDKGMDRHGHPIEIIDAMSTELHQAAKQTKTDPLAFIKQESLFGNLVKNDRFTELYTEAVHNIYKDPNIKKYMRDMIS